MNCIIQPHYTSIILLLLLNLLLLSILSSSNSKLIYKGVTFVGDRYCPNVTFEDPLALESLKNIAKTGANYIALVVTEYQDYADSTEIGPVYENPTYNDYYVYKTETIEGIKKIVKAAHELKIQVMLKPHIDLKKETQYTVIWRGSINMDSNSKDEERWKKWFQSYTKMIVKYAKLSEELKVEMLSISCELVDTNHRDSDWRNVIEEVRNVYHGMLTDSANPGEDSSKTWWDALDIIGIDAYYLPIRSSDLMYINEVDEELKDMVDNFESISNEFGGKDVIITEIGFCSGQCMIDNRNTQPVFYDHYVQAYFYERFIKILTKKAFIKGFFWWSWNTDPNTGGLDDHCITPQHKLAEYVLYKYYGGNVSNIEYKPRGKPKCLCTI